MALTRRSTQRVSGAIWPGFVDAMTALLLVLFFVLSIFMLVQMVLRETITFQDTELDVLTDQVLRLSDALGLERQETRRLEGEVTRLGSDLSSAISETQAQAALISALRGQVDEQQAVLDDRQMRITAFEAQVAALLSERNAAVARGEALAGELAETEAARDALANARSALELALAQARAEMDAEAEAARLAAARAEAVEALLADLRARAAETEGALASVRADLAETQAALTDEEQARLAEAAAAAALRERLAGATDELTAMTLALEEQRRRAEETLTMLAAAEAARRDLEAEVAGQAELAEQLSEAEARAAMLALAEARLAEEEQRSVEDQRRMALLNEQIAQLRVQLGSLQAVLDEARDRDASAQVQIEALGSQLNTALAQVASEQRRRAELEEAERRRLEAEAQRLERFSSEFFGQLRDLLAGREGVRIVGDRFVFSSEVLFEPGSADLAAEGRAQIAGVAQILREIAADIPPNIDWILRVDGHTDNVPLSGAGAFADNWELSQGRALSVVRFLQDDLGFPPDRLAATGFGEYRPVAEGNSPAARAQNRRIELKLTER